VDWQSACHLEQLAKKHKALLEAAAEEGKATLAKFIISAKLTPYAFYARLSKDVRETIEAVSRLERILDAACGKQSPSLEQFKSALFSIRRLVHDMMKEQPAPEDHALRFEEQEEELLVADDEGFEAQDANGHPRIRSRAEAYRLLDEAAHFLLRTEPHSPTPYLVKRAVAWGSMTLGELLQELISNENDLRQLYAFLGLHTVHDPAEEKVRTSA
jgi:type VI secretion system ImpA family protein